MFCYYSCLLKEFLPRLSLYHSLLSSMMYLLLSSVQQPFALYIPHYSSSILITSIRPSTKNPEMLNSWYFLKELTPFTSWLWQNSVNKFSQLVHKREESGTLHLLSFLKTIHFFFVHTTLKISSLPGVSSLLVSCTLDIGPKSSHYYLLLNVPV